MRIILVLLLIGGCKTARQDTSEPEFMTLPQDNPHIWYTQGLISTAERVLVKQAHKKSWNIDYGFANCNKNKRDQYRPKVVEAIHQSINLWLNPIRQMQKATNKGHLELVNKLNINEKKKLSSYTTTAFGKRYTTFDWQKHEKLHKKLSEKMVELADPTTIQQHKEFKRYKKFILTLPEMSVVFNCNEGRSSISPYLNSINMNEKESKDSIPETNFSFGTLLHEVGHAFGLADTYVNPRNPQRDHMDSSGIHPSTIGHQPMSVMSHSGYIFDSHQEARPTIDDKNGIFWIYVYMNRNKLNLDTCPLNYQSEVFARDEANKLPSTACRPKHPLLFAMASKNYPTAIQILNNKEERESIDINARSHEQGGTALHHALWSGAQLDYIKAILKFFHKEIDFSIAGFLNEKDFNIIGFHVQEGLPPRTVLEYAELALKASQQQNHQPSIKYWSAVVELLLKYGAGNSRQALNSITSFAL